MKVPDEAPFENGLGGPGGPSVPGRPATLDDKGGGWGAW